MGEKNDGHQFTEETLSKRKKSFRFFDFSSNPYTFILKSVLLFL